MASVLSIYLRVVRGLILTILALIHTSTLPMSLRQILIMEMAQVLSEVIFPQKPRVALATALFERAVQPLHLLLVVDALLVTLQICFASETLVAGLTV
jgi:hypothetical protein